MPSGSSTQLSLVIKAIDEATGPLRAISATIAKVTEPLKPVSNKLSALFEASGAEKLGKAFKGVGSATSDVGKEVFALGAKLAAMGAAAGFTLYSIIVKGAVEAGDKLSEMAARTGFAVDAFASLQFAFAQSDVDAEQFNAAMDQFNKRLGEAKAGGGPLLDFLKKVGPGLAEQVKGAKSTEEALSFMTDAFERLPDTQRRAALSAAAFGKSGLQVGEALHQGSAAIQGLQDRYLQLAGSQKAFADGASALDNAMREAETAFLGVRNAVAGALFPALTELSTVIANLVADNRESIAAWARDAGASFKEWVDGGGIQRVIDSVKGFASAVASVIESIGGWKTVLVGIGLVMAGPLLGAIGSLIASVWALGAAILATPLGWIIVGVAALAAGAVYLYSKFEVVREAVGFVFEPLKQAVGELWDSLKQLWDLIAPQLLPVLKVLGAVLGGVVLTVITLVAAQIMVAVKFTTMLVNAFTAVGNAVGNLLPKLGPLGTAVKAAVNPLGFIGQKLFGDSGGGEAQAQPQALSSFSSQPLAGADAASRPGQLYSSEPTKVQVEFANAPRGLRISQSSGDADVDLSVGYSMGVP